MRASLFSLTLTAAVLLAPPVFATDVTLRLVDQNNHEIAGSLIQVLGGTYGSGATVDLPIGGYTFSIIPGMAGSNNSGTLARDEAATVSAATTSLTFEWITSDVRVRVHDQYGVDIPESHLAIHTTRPIFMTGAVVSLPITDNTVYPTIRGDASQGYVVYVWPGLLGEVRENLIRTIAGNVVTASTTEFSFEWITAQVRLRLHDQFGVDIPESHLAVHTTRPIFMTGTVVSLPITDSTVYPTIGGDASQGYVVYVWPGLGGVVVEHLIRTIESNRVTVSTVDFAFEWIMHDCPLQVVDVNGVLVPGSGLVLPSPFSSFMIGGHVVLPITENAFYPTIGDVYANGYPIVVRPSDVSPASGTFAFEVLASGALQPGSFAIAGNTYSLVCQSNRPPVATAGDNLSILSSQQSSTTILGTASDPDHDALTYIWTEGASTLFGPAFVGGSGQSNLNLAALPALALGPHLLTLEVSDGQLTATSSMQLDVGNSPPTASCSGSGTYQFGMAPIVLGAVVADFDGNLIYYTWREGSVIYSAGTQPTVAGGAPASLPSLTLNSGTGVSQLSLGTHTLTLRYDDGFNPSADCSVSVQVVDTQAPTLAPASSTLVLWPPNHQMVNVTILANARDSSGASVFLTASVTSSEDPDKNGSGQTIPDFTTPVINQVNGSISLQLRAERAGKGPGRSYTITITATDLAGNHSSATVVIVAPHDQRRT